MADIVAEIQKNIPGTDRDRYEVAYDRGRSQARSALLFGGLGFGAALGAAAMWLLDPARGAGRRAELGQRLGALSRKAGRTAAGRTTDLRNRTEGVRDRARPARRSAGQGPRGTSPRCRGDRGGFDRRR